MLQVSRNSNVGKILGFLRVALAAWGPKQTRPMTTTPGTVAGVAKVAHVGKIRVSYAYQQVSNEVRCKLRVQLKLSSYRLAVRLDGSRLNSMHQQTMFNLICD